MPCLIACRSSSLVHSLYTIFPSDTIFLTNVFDLLKMNIQNGDSALTPSPCGRVLLGCGALSFCFALLLFCFFLDIVFDASC